MFGEKKKRSTGFYRVKWSFIKEVFFLQKFLFKKQNKKPKVTGLKNYQLQLYQNTKYRNTNYRYTEFHITERQNANYKSAEMQITAFISVSI